MNLEYLRSFHLIAHLHSVKDAAHKMQLSQPALSHQLHMLEEEFGVQLIDRNTKPLQLTEAGNMLLSRCQEMFDWVDEVGSSLKAVQHEMEGKIRIASPPGLGHSWLMPRILDFQKKYPKLTLHVEFLDMSKVRDRLEQHRADLIITIEQFHNPNFIFQSLFEEEMVLVCDKKHRLAHKDQWTYEKITASQWILFSEEDSSPQRWLKKTFGKNADISNPNVLVNDHDFILECLHQGRHIAILPKHLVIKELTQGHLIEIQPSRSKPLVNQVFCAYRARRQISAKIQTLLQFLKTERPPS